MGCWLASQHLEPARWVERGGHIRPLQVLVLSAVGLFALARTADACQCANGRVLPPVQFRPSDVVFLGRVVQSEPLTYVDLEVLERLMDD